MVVYDFYVQCVPPFPPETDPPLIVDPDAMLPRSLPLESLQSVAWRSPEIRERLGVVEHPELPAGDGLYVMRQPSGRFPAPYPLGLLALEGLDHTRIVPRRVNNVKQK